MCFFHCLRGSYRYQSCRNPFDLYCFMRSALFLHSLLCWIDKTESCIYMYKKRRKYFFVISDKRTLAVLCQSKCSEFIAVTENSRYFYGKLRLILPNYHIIYCANGQKCKKLQKSIYKSIRLWYHLITTEVRNILVGSSSLLCVPVFWRFSGCHFIIKILFKRSCYLFHRFWTSCWRNHHQDLIL